MKFIVVAVGAAVLLGASTAGAVSLLKGSKGSVLKVSLKEMRVIAASSQVASGKVTFVIRNGGQIEHELVVVKSSGRSKLPVKGYKAVEGNGNVGEVEGVMPGKSKRLTLNLKKGTYFLICNELGHYQLGMRTMLRVT
jgi:uncharacterized cupredoxin-like copper-binding protein